MRVPSQANNTNNTATVDASNNTSSTDATSGAEGTGARTDPFKDGYEAGSMMIANASGVNNGPTVRPNAQNGDFLGNPVYEDDKRLSNGRDPAPGRNYYANVRPTAYDSSSTSIHDVPPIRPRNGSASGPLILSVNGIDTPPEMALDNNQSLANMRGQNVVPIWNETDGAVADVLEAGAMLIGADDNDRATQVLADAIYDEVSAGRAIDVVAESQGAIITSNALEQVKERLLEDEGFFDGESMMGDEHYSYEEALEHVESQMQLIGVETYGGAAPTFPDGPRYDHYINVDTDGNGDFDVVSSSTGVGSGLPFVDPGEGARILKMDFGHGSNVGDGALVDNHAFGSYLEYMQQLMEQNLLEPGDDFDSDGDGWIDNSTLIADD